MVSEIFIVMEYNEGKELKDSIVEYLPKVLEP